MSQTADASGEGRIVTRSVFHLVAGQVFTSAISFVVTASIARHLGAKDYGVLFLATSFVSLFFVLVELGQNYYVVSSIARDPDRVDVLFGSGLALRLVAGLLLFLPAMGVARLLDYSELTRTAIAFTYLFQLVMSITTGFSVVFRGLERMDYDAASRILSKALYGVASLAAVVLSADVIGIIQAQVLGSALALVVPIVLLLRLEIPRPSVHLGTVVAVLRGGVPFLAMMTIGAIHQGADALVLSKLAQQDVIGWYGAARRLVLVLILPAGIIATALFPTLSRIWAQSPAAYRQTTRSVFRWVLFVGGLAAAGSWLFAEEAVTLVYGGEGFEGTADILTILSVFILAVFLNFALGTAILAGDRKKLWIGARGVAVATLVVLNLLLVPECQARFGNGGIGSATATAITEILLLMVALLLVPRGTLDWGLLPDVCRLPAGIAAMWAMKHLVGDAHIALAVPLAGLVFLGTIAALGGIGRRDLEELWLAILSRSGGPAPRAS